MKSSNINFKLASTIEKQNKLKRIAPVPIVLAGITALITYFKLDTSTPFIESWLSFYMVAIILIAPIGFVLLKGIDSLIKKTFKSSPKLLQNGIFGLLMAFSMGSLMTGASLFTRKIFASAYEFITAWGEGIIAGLPAFIIIAIIVGVVVKPKIDKRREKKQHI